MSKFLAEADSVLPSNAREYLSVRTTTDVREAGRCIAYDQHTAAGFHTVRAVEAVARHYYELVLDTHATEDGTVNGQPIRLKKIIDDLQRKYKNTMKEPSDHPIGMIIGDLDRIRVIYRNPIMHPEMVLTDNQATRVFNVGTDVISAMIDDIEVGGAHFKRMIDLPSLKGQF
jgi:hypothetical protein